MSAGENEVAALGAMSNAELKREWERVQQAPAPPIAPSLLARDLAHRVQLAAAGGMDRGLEQRLRKLVASHADVPGAGGRAAAPSSLAGGTQLLREWGGRTHRVIAEPDGSFLYAGERWRSLSAIARAITGTRWSGPRFFGTGG